MGADAVLEAVVDRAQVQVVGLDDAEVAVDVGEVFVACHHGGGVEGGGLDAGAQHIDTVKGGLGGDRGLVAMVGEAGVGDRGMKVLAHLVFARALPTALPISPAPLSRPACTRPAIAVSSLSVEASRSLRLRARSMASAGLRQAINRSPG